MGNEISHCLGSGLWMSEETLMLGHGYMTVSAFHFMHMHAQQVKLNAVYRVHWLRAKAQKTRWIEELQCLLVEMESAVRYFRHQEKFWQEKEEFIEPQLQPRHAAWVARQGTM